MSRFSVGPKNWVTTSLVGSCSFSIISAHLLVIMSSLIFQLLWFLEGFLCSLAITGQRYITDDISGPPVVFKVVRGCCCILAFWQCVVLVVGGSNLWR